MDSSGGHSKHAPRERVLFVHAHPDDESISTGGTIATLVDNHAHASVLTCTRGERGKVISAQLAHLEGDLAALAAVREAELAEALQALGVSDHRYLGAPGARWHGRQPRAYSDSGMRWGSAGVDVFDLPAADSFAGADFAEVTTDIAAAIAEIEPTAVVSYDHRGGSGHPDHIRAHYAARRAADVMGVPFYVVVEAYPADPVFDARHGDIVVDVEPVLPRKRAALAAHRTQIRVLGERSFVLASGDPRPIVPVELFRRLHRDRPRPAHPFAAQSAGSKVATAFIALLVGIAAGASLTLIHQATVSVADVPVPTGLVIGLLVLVALMLGLRLVFGTRWIAGAAALGALVAIGVLSLPSPGGSVLVPAGAVGYAWIFGPTLIAFVVLGWPVTRRPPMPSEQRYGGTSPVKGSLPE